MFGCLLLKQGKAFAGLMYILGAELRRVERTKGTETSWTGKMASSIRPDQR